MKARKKTKLEREIGHSKPQLQDVRQSQYRLLMNSSTIEQLLQVSSNEAQNYVGRLIEIDSDADNAYEAIAKVESARFDKRGGGYYKAKDPKRDLANKVRGIKGEMAILSVLNQHKIWYNFDHQLLYLPEDKLGPDFILYPSGLKVEVKTGPADCNDLLINESQYKRWVKRNEIPGVILALSATSNDYVFEVKGWVKGNSANDKSRINKRLPSPAYSWPYDEINKIDDVADFLYSLSKYGLSRLT